MDNRPEPVIGHKRGEQQRERGRATISRLERRVTASVAAIASQSMPPRPAMLRLHITQSSRCTRWPTTQARRRWSRQRTPLTIVPMLRVTSPQAAR